jgi:putative DNA primase/helicase
VRVPGGEVKASKLYAVYLAWSAATGERASSAFLVGFDLSNRGYQARRAAVTYWRDIRLTKSVEDFLDGHGNPFGAQGAAP